MHLSGSHGLQSVPASDSGANHDGGRRRLTVRGVLLFEGATKLIVLLLKVGVGIAS
ncbi:MAG: hypothetical protein ACI8TX_000536 [Hyphomicrobiaceae bacterium]|jgi:hypothetical protein